MREGQYPQHISQMTEIWKGRHKEEKVALKIFRAHRDDPPAQVVESVSMPRNFKQGVFLCIGLTDGIEVLGGGGFHEVAQTQEYSPSLRSINRCLKLLPGVPLV